ncbi:MAG: hypothetical protein DRJ39_01145 [Thermoprotei archaeon]|nr:MAG: hypothetical protein DRJ39_01145 [Thermoprotei archaeon]
MSRPLVRMIEKGEGVDLASIRGEIKDVADMLAEYLNNYYWPEQTGYAKHSIMGPVGKLIGVMESGRFESKEALIGFIINIHNNTSRVKISKEAIDILERAVDKLLEIRSKTTTRVWVRLLRELDYAVYKYKMKRIVELAAQKAKSKSGGE